jgi:hypothetical protein
VIFAPLVKMSFAPEHPKGQKALKMLDFWVTELPRDNILDYPRIKSYLISVREVR